MTPCEACGGWGLVGPAEFRFTCVECDGTGWIHQDLALRGRSNHPPNNRRTP